MNGHIAAQILLDLKNLDPSAVTAAEAIRTLLGYGDRLVSIRRRALHEIEVDAAPPSKAGEQLAVLLARYLDETVVFWNPNKQRAWVRIEDGTGAGMRWEVLSGGRRGDPVFGRPGLDEPEYDHVLVWDRGAGERDGVSGDLAGALSGWTLRSAGRGELWSVRWRAGASPEERADWTLGIGAARSRREGLLVNPHAQEHRVVSGAVSIPFWVDVSGTAGAVRQARTGR